MAKSRQHTTSSTMSVLGLVLLAAVAASPAMAARRTVRHHSQYHPPAGVIPRQVQQQWQVAVNRPPSAFLKQDASELPPAAPGHVWVQVPITEVPPHPDAVDSGATDSSSGTSVEAAGAAPEGSTEAPVVTSDPEMLKHCKEARGQFAHPGDCSKFYNCWDGYVVEQECPGQLAFSDQGPFCDYVMNVDCSSRGGDPPAPTTQKPAQTGSAEAGGAGGAGGAETAPDSSVENTSESSPSGPSEGGESGEEGVGEQVSEEQLKEDIGEGCKEAYSRYRSPKNCSVFIVCDNSLPYRFACPQSLNYNEKLGVCDYPYRVDCGNSTSDYPADMGPTEAPAAQQEVAPAQEQVPEEVWRHFYQQQQQYRLPANAPASVYYGGFANLPPIKVVPGYYRQN